MKHWALVTILLVLSAARAQDFSDVKIEKAFAGYRFTEGPSWSHEGYLVFADLPANHLLKWVPGQKLEMLKQDSGGATGTAFDHEGRLYVCESRARRVSRIDKQGKAEVIAERWEGKRFNAPNDVVVRKDGNVWFTDPAFGAQADTRELDFHGVFRVTPKGVLELLAKTKTRPNGIALSANGRTLYVTNSDERNVRAWDLDKIGAASNERVVLSNIKGVPDGIRLDEKNNIYVAARGVTVYAPDGKIIREFEFAEKPSNVTFGDADLQSLFVTARTSVYRIRLNVKGAVPN